MRTVFGPAATLGLLLAVAVPLEAQRAYGASLTGARVEHRVRAGSGIERGSGTLVGGEVGATSSWLELRGHALGGRLTSRSSVGDDRTVGELALQASALPLPWLAFTLGATGRTYTTPLARQRWLAVSTGVEARAELLDGALRGTASVGLMPAVSVSGHDAPDFAAVSAVGMAYRGPLLTAGVAYSLERFDFPAVDGTRRLEQLSRLTASAGIRFGR